MKDKRAIYYWIGFLLIVCLMLTSCGGEEKDESQEPFTIRVNEVIRSPFYAPQYVALGLGFFAEENLEVVLETSWNGESSLTALLEKTSDIGLIGTETSIQWAKQGDPIKLINFAQLTQKDGSFLVAREPVATFMWNDVAKKIIIGGRKGSTPQVILEYLLKKNDLVPQKEVEIINNIRIDLTRGAFIGGIGDYIQILEPSLSLLEQGDVGHIVTYIGQDTGYLTHTTYMATQDYIKENQKAIQNFTNALYKAQIWCANHTAEEIAQVIKPFFPDYPINVVLQGVKRYKEYDAWSHNPLVQEAGLQRLQDIMVGVGELEEKIPFETIADNAFALKSIDTIPLPAKK